MDRQSTASPGVGSGETTQQSNPFFERRLREARVGPAVAARPVVPATAALQPSVSAWGWLPAIILVASLGLLSVGSAMQLARQETAASIAPPMFWLGLLLIFVPVAFRMALPQVQRRERIALVVWLGLALYLVKVLRSPAGFTFHDEFPHYATADLILRTGRLFGSNSLQPVSAYFPGLEIVTTALAGVGGMSIEAAGLIVVGLARVVGSLATYLLYEEISGSPRVAGIGSLLAVAYPNYVFWSSQYGYESLALPLAVLVLMVGLLKGRRTAPSAGLTAVALTITAAVVITHHVTSYFLAASLLSVYLFTRFGQPVISHAERLAQRMPRLFARLVPASRWVRPTEHVTRPQHWFALALATIGTAAVWLALVGHEIISYLEPHLAAAAAGFVRLFVKKQAARQPFSSSSTTAAAATWEQLVAFAAVLLILIVIPFGLIQIWRRYRRHGVALLFAAATLAYPFTLVLRLAGGGAEIANRSWDFLFVAYGFVLAAGIAELWVSPTAAFRRAALFAAYAGVLLMGAVIVGTPAWARLPGTFMVGGDTRGLQPESYALKDWMRDELGPDNRIIADYSNKLLLGSLGEQYNVTGLSWVYISPKLSEDSELADLVKRGVNYVVVDDRLTTQTPRIGHYFEPSEPGSPWLEPLPASALTKFDRAACLSRIFDSGHITVYEVSRDCAPQESVVQP